MPGGARSRHSVAWPGPSRQGSRRVNGPETPTDRPTKGRPARPVVHLPQAWRKCQLMVVQHPRSRDAGVGVPRATSVRFCPLSANWLPHRRWNQLSPVKSQTCWGPRRAGNWFQKHRTRCLELSACCSSMLTVEGSVLPAAPIAARPRQLRVATWRDSNALTATVVRLRLPTRKLVWNRRHRHACWLLLISGLGFDSLAAHLVRDSFTRQRSPSNQP